MHKKGGTYVDRGTETVRLNAKEREQYLVAEAEKKSKASKKNESKNADKEAVNTSSESK